MRVAQLSAAALGLLLLPAAALAQEREPGTVTLRGRVIDARSRAPIAGAWVSRTGSLQAYVTDSLGLFVLEAYAAGAYRLSVEQLGYETAEVTLDSTAPKEFTTILLDPNPVQLEGLRVLVDRFERRRRFYFGPVRTLEQDRLRRSAGTAYDVVRRSVPASRPCTSDAQELCFFRRGRIRRARICIDEIRAYGGATELETYDPAELYLVEVYDGGLQVRVYTRWFVERMMRRGRRLQPLSWGCP